MTALAAATKMSRGRSMVAAAQVLQSRRIDRVLKPRGTQSLAWQIEAWEAFDRVGEFSWVVDQQAWAVSQVRLIAARDVANQDEPEVITGEIPEPGSDDEPPSEADQIAADLVAGFAGGTTGQQQLIRRVATQLIVSAESYIVGRSNPAGDGEDVWEAYSRDEVKWSTRGWKVDDGVEKFDLGEDDVLIRVWIPHPRRRQEARSSTKPLLPVLAEIEALTASIAAQVDSRLAGAGLLILPKSVDLVGSQKASSDTEDDDQDPFMAEFIDMMITPIKDRGSAAAVVPIIIKVDDEAVGKIQYLRFESQVDIGEADKREKAVTRLARGMDLDPAKLLGMGDANHWSAWQIDESTIKGPISSLGAIITHALTIGWYRPALETAFELANLDLEDIPERMVWFDPAALQHRPDLSENAQNVFKLGGLSFEGLVRENGLNVEDIPEGAELCRVLLFRLIDAHPEMTGVLLLALGPCAGIKDLEDLDPVLLAMPATTTPPADQVVDDSAGQRALPSRDTAPPGTDAGAP